jgi:hypothetical protein
MYFNIFFLMLLCYSDLWLWTVSTTHVTKKNLTSVSLRCRCIPVASLRSNCSLLHVLRRCFADQVSSSLGRWEAQMIRSLGWSVPGPIASLLQCSSVVRRPTTGLTRLKNKRPCRHAMVG